MYRVDLNWNDLEALPDKMRPDIEYLFGRMNEAVMQMVDAHPGDIIVDVGCGRGIEVLKMSQAGAFVIGIEPSGFMLERAIETAWYFGHNTVLIRGIGESLPVAMHTVDKVLCKGALDHFADPAQAIYQMTLAVKPGGHVIIALANFESLGFKVGKFIFMLRRILGIKNPYPRLPWELPHDHTIKFDYNSIVKATRSYLDIEKVTGISLLCSRRDHCLEYTPKCCQCFLFGCRGQRLVEQEASHRG